MPSPTRLSPIVAIAAAALCFSSLAPVAGQTIAGCNLGSSPASVVPTSTNCAGGGNSLDLGCVALPGTNLMQQPDFDVFAWNSFAALNWPAVDPDANNFQRGIPDKSESFVGAAPTDLLVWETYIEKRELFYNGLNPPPDPGPWNKCVQYGGPPPGPEHRTGCTSPLTGEPSSGQTSRAMMQPIKTPFDQFDETIEVASEALESTGLLCQGHTPNSCPGSPCCSVQGMPVGPRVWKGTPTSDTPPRVGSGTGVEPVVYEVKVNYDFYDYVRTNQYYDDKVKKRAALAGVVNLPVRSSATRFPPPSFQPKNAPLRYNAFECAKSYPETVDPQGDLLPCRAGSVHLKAAWIWLGDTLEDVPADVQSKYHIAESLYFSTEQGEQVVEEGVFGLIGLHIIQRIHTQIVHDPGGMDQDIQRGQTNPVGGSFVFATWEHVDNDSAGFTYSNYLPYSVPGADPAPGEGFYPTPSNAIPLQRKFPMPAGTCQVNQQVHAALKAANPNSIWLNYALVGTQYLAVEAVENPDGQSFFLANLVIESNDGLQEFQGQPPKLTPIATFGRVAGNDTYGYRRQGKNTVYQYQSRGSTYQGTNMGGCMGCHGVAQLNGTAFSFVLLLGQAGASTDTQLDFEVPAEPAKPPQ